MIQFSVFLQDNEKKKQKAAEKITTEKKLTMEKEAEIEAQILLKTILGEKNVKNLGK